MATIKSIKRKKITNQKLYNLAVLEDESYITNDVVVHNCRSILVPITNIEVEQAVSEKKGFDVIKENQIRSQRAKGFKKN